MTTMHRDNPELRAESFMIAAVLLTQIGLKVFQPNQKPPLYLKNVGTPTATKYKLRGEKKWKFSLA